MKARLKQLLNQRKKQHITNPNRVLSAVLIPVFEKEGQYHLIFIKRTETVKAHKGQISFPGGTFEEKDKTLLNTALRECDEEIGLYTGDAEIMGELDDEATVTSCYIISPYVAMIPWPYRFRMNRDEVAEIIEIPISALLDEDCLEKKTELVDDKMVESYTYKYQGRIIWGATARILNLFLDLYSKASQGS